MDFLLWSEEAVREGDLSEGQILLWQAVRRVVNGADSHRSATALIEKKILTKEELVELFQSVDTDQSADVSEKEYDAWVDKQKEEANKDLLPLSTHS